MELGFDCFEKCWDRVGLGEVCFEREKSFGGLGAIPTPRHNSDLVAVAGELLSNGGADSGPRSENKDDGVGGHLEFILDGKDGIQGFGL